MAIAHASGRQVIGQARGEIRESPLSPPPQRHQTQADNAYHGTCSPSRRRYRGFTGSRRREEALKKPSSIGSALGSLPSPPKQHEEFPGEQLPPSADACLQANAAAAVSATLTHLSQHHRLTFWGLGRSLRPSFGHGAQVWRPR